MSRLIITRADEVLRTLSEQPIAAVLSIEHPGVIAGTEAAAPRLQDPPQLILRFWDMEQQVSHGPDMAQIKAGLMFVMEHMERGDVLIHCHAGKSRSVAIALGVLALRHPELEENALLEKLLEIRPIAAPNILIVEMVDTLSGRQGRLTAAVHAHPQIAQQRAETEVRRQAYLKEHPERYKNLYPEKPPQP